jgi:hypothetical protein
MPVDTRIDATTRLRTHRVTGSPTLEDILEALQAIYALPDYRADANVLWDLREAELEGFSKGAVHYLANFVGKNWVKQETTRAALVVARDVDYGLARMYEQLLQTQNVGQVMIFRDVDEAMDWLR